MIPVVANAIRQRVWDIVSFHPEFTDKQVYARYLAYYYKLCKCGYETISRDDVPSEDTVLRRVREIRQELRENQKKKLV